MTCLLVGLGFVVAGLIVNLTTSTVSAWDYVLHAIGISLLLYGWYLWVRLSE